MIYGVDENYKERRLKGTFNKYPSVDDMKTIYIDI